MNDRGSSRWVRRWPELEVLGLQAVGVATVVAGGLFVYIALGLGARTSGDPDLRILSGAVGVATILAGILAIGRIREDLVGSILGAFTAAAFTIGAAQTTQPTTTWSVFYPAAILGGLLVGFLAFRGAFRRPR